MHNERLKELMRQCGHTSRTLSDSINVPFNTVHNWVFNNSTPQNDEAVYKVAALLFAEPTEIWPLWSPGKRCPDKKQNNMREGGRSKHDDSMLGWSRMETAQNAKVWIGKKYGFPVNQGRGIYSYHAATVVQMTPWWFRVRVDCNKASYFECFTYQALRECALKPYDPKRYKEV